MKAQLTRLLDKNLHRWAGPWAAHTARKALQRLHEPLTGPRHLIFCFCDHYEPEWGAPGPARGEARVRAWQEGYPRALGGFRDGHGRPPQHSFFFPGEEYRPEYLKRLTELCAGGFGEVELHLHHDGDNAAELRQKIADYLKILGSHGHFSRSGNGGAPRYAFIHGNWALGNGNPGGAECGVDEELSVLFESGCYADYTFPSAPHPSQPPIVNQIFWPTGDLQQRRAYDHGSAARVGERRHDRILMVEGPLALGLHPRPRIEAAAITAHDPGTPERVARWARQGIGIKGRPEWVFVKVHTHGAPEPQAESLLGAPGQALHQALQRYNDGQRWVLHYVTARELYNIACAAMDGRSGDPGAYRDYLLLPPPCRGGAPTASP